MAIGSGILLVKFMWFHMGYIDVKVYRVPVHHISCSHRSAWPINSSSFLGAGPPLPFHPSSYWLRLFSSQTFPRINTPSFSNLVILYTYSPMKMEQTECSETSAYNIQMPGNYPKENIQHIIKFLTN